MRRYSQTHQKPGAETFSHLASKTHDSITQSEELWAARRVCVKNLYIIASCDVLPPPRSRHLTPLIQQNPVETRK